MDEFLEQLAGRLQVYDSEILTADETKDWPQGKRDELIAAKILTPIENAKRVICDQCEENCYIEPCIRTNPETREAVGIFMCKRNPDIGRIEVDLDRLRQWKIEKEKLKELGLLKKKVKRRMRKVSSELTPKETEVYTLIHIKKKTQKQAAIEMRCTPQNISNLLTKAEEKIKARQSRSVSLKKAQRLPQDKRSQVNISKEDI